MNKNICVFVLLFVCVITTRALPAAQSANNQGAKDDKKNDGLFGRPLLELTNGGIRVNFGGYHAEAGLGGLLGQSGTGGGLYAGAGTPFGAHASAGLGGAVNGENGGKTGGLLHARAGLGNGGPEAAAGLGGNLDGADPSRSSGAAWKATSYNGRTRITMKTKNKLAPDQTNVQAIPANREELMTHSAAKTESKVNDADGAMVRREIPVLDEKINVIEPVAANSITIAPPVYVSPTRNCRRKRICRGIRKTVITKNIPYSPLSTEFIGAPIAPASIGVQGEISTDTTGYKDVSVVSGPAPKPQQTLHQKSRSTTLFDDIFNIPIAALTAVNQLLNNKAG